MHAIARHTCCILLTLELAQVMDRYLREFVRREAAAGGLIVRDFRENKYSTRNM